MKRIDPETTAKTAARYTQGMLIERERKRLLISAQTGLKPDGTMERTAKAQFDRAWSNLFAVLHDAGFKKKHLVKVTIFVSEPGQISTFREIRDRVLDGHLCAATFLQVAGFATSEMKVSIEGEAVKEHA